MLNSFIDRIYFLRETCSVISYQSLLRCVLKMSKCFSWMVHFEVFSISTVDVAYLIMPELNVD